HVSGLVLRWMAKVARPQRSLKPAQRGLNVPAMSLVWINLFSRRRFHFRLPSSTTSSRKVGPLGFHSSINSTMRCLYSPESSPGMGTGVEEVAWVKGLGGLELGVRTAELFSRLSGLCVDGIESFGVRMEAPSLRGS